MQGRLEGIRFDIKKIGQDGDFGKYKISIKVPMKLGWVEGMNFIAGGDGFCQTVQLKYTKKDDEMVYFEAEAKLRTQAIYHYHFSFELNGETVNFKKGDDKHLDWVTDDEKWQMPVNFEVPEWAKDKIMYHVFVDRFCRGSKSLPPEMPRRTVHQSWNEPPLVGPDKNGIWNADFYGGDLKGIEQKLDYIILLQNNIINNFKGMNKELSLNINSIKDINNKLNKEISNQEFNDNINIIEQNIKNLENMLQNHFNSDIFDNFNNISIPDINENENFFNELQKIYNPIKEINKAYEHLLIES